MQVDITKQSWHFTQLPEIFANQENFYGEHKFKAIYSIIDQCKGFYPNVL